MHIFWILFAEFEIGNLSQKNVSPLGGFAISLWLPRASALG
jgi:hypothetical protein